ncbi:MAG: hypothetical protein JSV33_06000 [bacterium]|nr:MAG: hypothetical protein JSV33_06000 [bacterium]
MNKLTMEESLMSNGLNNSLSANTLIFLQNHAVTTALLGAHHPRLGVSNWDLMRSENYPADQGAILLPVPAGGVTLEDPALEAYWLPQGGHIEVPINNPAAPFIFTPEFSGCKLYVDKVWAQPYYRIFHIQCDHEAAEYPANMRGDRLATIDSRDYGEAPSVDGPAYPHRIGVIRCTVLMYFVGGAGWSIYLQGLTGIGPGISDGRLVYPPGPAQNVSGVVVKQVP